MANTKNGTRGNWSGSYVATLDGTVTLTHSDSGKTFLCDTATVTFPSAAAGWNAKFIHKDGASTINSVSLSDTAGKSQEWVCDGTTFYKNVN